MRLIDVRQISGDGTLAEWLARDHETRRPLYIRFRGVLTVEAGPPGAPPDDGVGGEVLLQAGLGDGWRVPEWSEVQPLVSALPVPVATSEIVTKIPRRCAVRVEPPGGLRDEEAVAGFVVVEEISSGVDSVGYIEVDALGARTYARSRVGKHRHRMLAVVEQLLADISDHDQRWLAHSVDLVSREMACCGMFGDGPWDDFFASSGIDFPDREQPTADRRDDGDAE